MENQVIVLSELLSALIYSGIGIVIFVLAFTTIVKLSPFPVIKEIEEDQNISLAIIIGAVFIGVAIIIAASISS